MSGHDAYCVRCKKKVTVMDAEEVEMKNGRRAVRGTCHECRCGIYKILPGKRK